MLGTPEFVDMTDLNVDGVPGYTTLTPCTWQDLGLGALVDLGPLYIVTVYANYLECNSEPDSDGNTYYVAKPTRLRSTDTAARAVANQSYTLTKSAFTTGVYSGDAQSCTGTRSSDRATETLGVDEPYLIGDEITVIPSITGLTDPDSNIIMLVDANVDARHWTAKNAS
jgi:hypothetical protein